MANIALSAGVRTNLLSLQGTANMLTATQERLATGKKVNSALDNPTNFFTAQALSERATSLTSLQDGINTGVQTVKAANKGLDTISSLLKQAKSIAEQAKTGGAALPTKGVDGLIPLTITAGATGTSVVERTRTSTVAGNGITAGSTLVFSGTKNGVVSNFTFTEGAAGSTTIGDLVDKVNASGVATVKINDNGTLSFDGATGSTAFTITSSANTANALGLAGLAAAGTNTTITVLDRPATGSAGNGQNYQSQFADVMTAINQAVGDSNYNGINLLQGQSSNDLTVTFDGASKSSITVKSSSFAIEAGGITLSALGGDPNTNLAQIDVALAKVRGQQGEYGNKLAIMQTRLDFSKDLSNMLEVGADNLTLADTNKEAANLLALQTRQSLSQSALSLANQSDQAVLQLLR